MSDNNGMLVVNAQTGEVYAPKQRKIKRTEPFFMVEQKSAIELAKESFTGMDLRILLYLQGLADYDNICQPSQKFLAFELSTTEATVSISIKHLVEKGAITIENIAGRKAFKINSNVSTRGKMK